MIPDTADYDARRYLSRNYDDLLQAAYRIAGKDGPDLLHEVILQLYQTKQDTIDGLLERDQMKYWVLRVMVNNYNSKTSRYHYKWRKDIERRRKFARHIVDWWDGDGVAAHRDELLTHIEERLAELPWFDAEVFAIYFEEGHTLDSLRRGDGHQPPQTIHHNTTCQKRNPRGSATRSRS